jgi:hypothetical protein
MESNRSCPSALARFFPGDFVAASAFFAAFNTGQSVAEFLFNPLLGCLSDNMGRRLFLLAWSARSGHPTTTSSPQQPSAQQPSAAISSHRYQPRRPRRPPINTLTRLLVIWRGSPRVLFWQQVLRKQGWPKSLAKLRPLVPGPSAKALSQAARFGPTLFNITRLHRCW